MVRRSFSGKGPKMEVERLVEKLRWLLVEVQGLRELGGPDVELPDNVYAVMDETEHAPIQLNKGRTVATVAKMLRDAGEEQVAGVAMDQRGTRG